MRLAGGGLRRSTLSEQRHSLHPEKINLMRASGQECITCGQPVHAPLPDSAIKATFGSACHTAAELGILPRSPLLRRLMETTPPAPNTSVLRQSAGNSSSLRLNQTQRQLFLSLATTEVEGERWTSANFFDLNCVQKSGGKATQRVRERATGRSSVLYNEGAPSSSFGSNLT